MYQKTFIFFALIYILFFVKTWASLTGNIYGHDDIVYYAQTASFVNDFDADIQNNLGGKSVPLRVSEQTGKMLSYQPLGTSLLYVLPYTLTKPVVLLINFLRGIPFNDYDPLFFIILNFFTLVLFYFSGLFLVKGLSLAVAKWAAELAALFALWGTILPVYVFRRPIFAVVPEFFSVSLLVFYLLFLKKSDSISLQKMIILGFLSGWLSIVRWNDAFLIPVTSALAFAVTFESLKAGKSKIERWGRSLLALSACFLTAVLVFALTQGWLWVKLSGGVNEYLSFYFSIDHNHQAGLPKQTDLLLIITAQIKNLLHVLFGLDWGVLFTMPILIFGFFGVFFASKKIWPENRVLDLLVWFLVFMVPFALVLKWKNTGEFYGYRFLTCLIPFATFGVSLLFEKLSSHQTRLQGLVFLFCLLNFFIILPFEFVDSTTLHFDVITPMGGRGWGNNAYVLNALTFYFTSSLKVLIAAFSRGFLGATLFGILSFLSINLNQFGEKVSLYFALDGYPKYIAFVYLVISILFLLSLTSLRRRLPRVQKK